MIDWQNELGQRTYQRLIAEPVIWLTTVSAGGVPQPRPVWFVWNGAALIIYSSPQAWKLKHIARHPKVALHFNTDADGYDIQVILGHARIDPELSQAGLIEAYREKYGADIRQLGMSEAKYAAIFSVALRIVPLRLRGLEPIPEP
jgi:PPOX class probable F420-dependent enzyme